MEEAVLTCFMASGQNLLLSAQPIIWHLVLLDRDLCGNSMFQQRLLISVMPVVWRRKTLISLWSHISTLSTVETQSAWDEGMFWDVKPWHVFNVLNFLGVWWGLDMRRFVKWETYHGEMSFLGLSIHTVLYLESSVPLWQQEKLW